MILKKIFLISLTPLLLIIYLYFILGFTYNNLIVSDFKFNGIKKYHDLKTQLEKDIVNTNAFNNIINEVLNDSFKCSFFRYKSLKSSELLEYIDKNLSSLTNELYVYDYEVNSIRNTSYMILRNVYSSIENNVNPNKDIVDELFSVDSIRLFFMLYCLILMITMFVSEGFEWLKYNGVCMILVSFIFYLVLFSLKNIFSLAPMYASNVFFTIISKALEVSIKYLIVYLIVGFTCVIGYYILNKFLFNKNKN